MTEVSTVPYPVPPAPQRAGPTYSGNLIKHFNTRGKRALSDFSGSVILGHKRHQLHSSQIIDRSHQQRDSKSSLHPGQLISWKGGHRVEVWYSTLTATTQPTQKAGPGREESAGEDKSGNEFQSFCWWAFRA